MLTLKARNAFNKIQLQGMQGGSRPIKKGGILFTFSCSGVIDKNLFYNKDASAAIESRRHIKLLHTLSCRQMHVRAKSIK